MVLPGDTHSDVWGFSLKVNDRYYWSWKPTVVDKLSLTDDKVKLFDDGTEVKVYLLQMKAALVRETPGGPNLVSKTVTKSGSYDNWCLIGAIPKPCSAEDATAQAEVFCEHMAHPKIVAAYHGSMMYSCQSMAIKNDCQPGANLWRLLAGAAGNIEYRRIYALNEVLLDHKIEEVLRSLYGIQGGVSPSMWPVEIRRAGYGSAGEGSRG